MTGGASYFTLEAQARATKMALAAISITANWYAGPGCCYSSCFIDNTIPVSNYNS